MNGYTTTPTTSDHLPAWEVDSQRWLILASCWAWFFLVLFAYYLVKPVRDGYGSVLARHLGDIYLATFISTVVLLPIYSKIVSAVTRTQLVHGVNQFFVVCLLGFSVGFAQFDPPPIWLVATFFVWVSVFNLFVVTVFWSVMVDLFGSREGQTWFGSMAAAGSLGSLCGSAVAYQVSQRLEPYSLLIGTIICLEVIVLNAWWLLGHRAFSGTSATSTRLYLTDDESQPTRDGGIFAGVTHALRSPYLLGICLFVAFGKFSATFVYNNLQLAVLAAMPDDEQGRTILFSRINLWSQSGSLLLQGIAASLLMRFLGVGVTLMIPCGLLLGLFVWLSFQATLASLVVGQVAQQVLGYGLLVPAQHVLFTVVSREDKYKTKAFVDTVVFRGSDVAAGKLCQWMTGTGIALAALSLWMLPAMTVWFMIAAGLGIAYQRRARAQSADVVTYDI